MSRMAISSTNRSAAVKNRPRTNPDGDPNKKLTAQQQAFSMEVAKGNGVGAAALRAGYADEHIGFAVVKAPHVAAEIARLKAQNEVDAQMDRRQVMDGIKEAIDMAKLMSEPSSMIQGWKVIAQMCGYMAPVETKIKVDITGNVTMTRLTQMTDAELLELIERGASAPQQLT